MGATMAFREYSYKLKKEVFLLDEAEYAEIGPLYSKALEEASEYQRQTGTSIKQGGIEATVSGKAVLALYAELTKNEIQSVFDILSLRALDYGAPCPKCGRPFRTPHAKLCVECGHELTDGKVAGAYVPESEHI